MHNKSMNVSINESINQSINIRLLRHARTQSWTICKNTIQYNTERDLAVIVHKSLKPTSQCTEAVKFADKTLGMISRTFMFKDKNTMLRLCKSLTRPKLEYSI